MPLHPREAPEVRAPVRIGKASLFVEKATEGK
jgi:hypothetical protein